MSLLGPAFQSDDFQYAVANFAGVVSVQLHRCEKSFLFVSPKRSWRTFQALSQCAPADQALLELAHLKATELVFFWFRPPVCQSRIFKGKDFAHPIADRTPTKPNGMQQSSEFSAS
jgi:hypothetical protein